MQRFYPAVEDGRVACQALHGFDGNAKAFDERLRATCGINGDVVLVQLVDDGFEAVFIEYRDKGGGDFLRFQSMDPVCGLGSIPKRINRE